MVKEGIYYENRNGRKKVGVEILATPWAYCSNEELFRVINEDIDFKVFLHHLQHTEEGMVNFINIKPPTLIKFRDEIVILMEQNKNVVLELSEDFIGNAELNMLAKLKENHRLKISLDDFGKSSSNIDRVVALFPEFVKLDIRMFPSEKSLATLVETITRISPYTRVIAEGVESPHDLLFLRRLKITLWQGFLEKSLNGLRICL